MPSRPFFIPLPLAGDSNKDEKEKASKLTASFSPRGRWVLNEQGNQSYNCENDDDVQKEKVKERRERDPKPERHEGERREIGG